MSFALDVGLSYARNAGADLSAKLFYLAKVAADGDIELAGAGEAALGAITEAAAENKPVTVQFGGIAKVIAGASFNAGVMLAADSDGKAVTATTGNEVVGIALEVSGGANEIVAVALLSGRVP